MAYAEHLTNAHLFQIHSGNKAFKTPIEEFVRLLNKAMLIYYGYQGGKDAQLNRLIQKNLQHHDELEVKGFPSNWPPELKAMMERVFCYWALCSIRQAPLEREYRMGLGPFLSTSRAVINEMIDGSLPDPVIRITGFLARIMRAERKGLPTELMFYATLLTFYSGKILQAPDHKVTASSKQRTACSMTPWVITGVDTLSQYLEHYSQLEKDAYWQSVEELDAQQAIKQVLLAARYAKSILPQIMGDPELKPFRGALVRRCLQHVTVALSCVSRHMSANSSGERLTKVGPMGKVLEACACVLMVFVEEPDELAEELAIQGRLSQSIMLNNALSRLTLILTQINLPRKMGEKADADARILVDELACGQESSAEEEPHDPVDAILAASKVKHQDMDETAILSPTEQSLAHFRAMSELEKTKTTRQDPMSESSIILPLPKKTQMLNQELLKGHSKRREKFTPPSLSFENE